MTAEKVRDGTTAEVLLTFRLASVDLGAMADIDPHADAEERRTSCVVEPTDAQAPPPGARLTDTDQTALRVLTDHCGEKGERPAATSLRPMGLPCAYVAEWRERFRRDRGVDARDAKAMDSSRKAFQRAVDKLVARRLVGVHETRVWIW